MMKKFQFSQLGFIKPELKRLDSGNLQHWAAIGFGSGLSPKAPGTVGTLAAIPFWWLINDLTLPFYLLIVVISFIAGIAFCNSATKAIGCHDHGAIVWDEFVGLWLTLLAAPAGIGWLITGFCLFRFFDILKPWPIRWLDKRVKGGFGIMVDDLLAGLFGLICLQLLAYFLA